VFLSESVTRIHLGPGHRLVFHLPAGLLGDDRSARLVPRILSGHRSVRAHDVHLLHGVLEHLELALDLAFVFLDLELEFPVVDHHTVRLRRLGADLVNIVDRAFLHDDLIDRERV
jgi:hypothetical protein